MWPGPGSRRLDVEFWTMVWKSYFCFTKDTERLVWLIIKLTCASSLQQEYVESEALCWKPGWKAVLSGTQRQMGTKQEQPQVQRSRAPLGTHILWLEPSQIPTYLCPSLLAYMPVLSAGHTIRLQIHTHTPSLLAKGTVRLLCDYTHTHTIRLQILYTHTHTLL